jgi:hypothetical protein
LSGARRSFEPNSALHAQHWTYEYPSLALLPMASLVNLANDVDPVHGDRSRPSLFIYSPMDSVIDPELVRAMAENWGGAAEIVEVTDSDDPNNHVIAGDALSPGTTEAAGPNGGKLDFSSLAAPSPLSSGFLPGKSRQIRSDWR